MTTEHVGTIEQLRLCKINVRTSGATCTSPPRPWPTTRDDEFMHVATGCGTTGTPHRHDLLATR